MLNALKRAINLYRYQKTLSPLWILRNKQWIAQWKTEQSWCGYLFSVSQNSLQFGFSRSFSSDFLFESLVSKKAFSDLLRQGRRVTPNSWLKEDNAGGFTLAYFWEKYSVLFWILSYWHDFWRQWSQHTKELSIVVQSWVKHKNSFLCVYICLKDSHWVVLF